MSAAAQPVTEDISIGGIDDGIDINNQASLQPNLSEEELEKQRRQEEYKEELTKIQEDIATLRLVLNDKLKRENELKTLLGISFLTEMKNDLANGLTTVKGTSAFQQVAQTFSEIGSTVTNNDAYKQTTAGVKTSVQKVTPGFTMIGTSIKGSLSNLKNSTYFKSFNDGLASTVNTVQGKLKNSQSAFNVDDSVSNNNTMSSSQSTLGTSDTTTNGVGKHETIKEDN